MVKVKLDKLVEDVLMQGDEITGYLDKTTGETVLINSEDESAAENEEGTDKYPEWQQGTIKIAKEILDETTDKYIQLPSRFDVHEYKIMENFCETIEDERNRRVVEIALRGSGAFRRFKDFIHEFDLAEQWYKFRDEAVKEIVIEWCDDNDLEYE